MILWKTHPKTDLCYNKNMARHVVPSGVAIALVAAFFVGLFVGKGSTINPAGPVATPTPALLVGKPQEGTYRVGRVLDGDTVELTSGERVRYHGIDAPELSDRWGTVAYKTNRALVEGKDVRIELDRQIFDVYGRMLAFVWVGDTLINERLVDDGLATVLVIKGETKPKYLSLLQAAELRAKTARRGVWTERP